MLVPVPTKRSHTSVAILLGHCKPILFSDPENSGASLYSPVTFFPPETDITQWQVKLEFTSNWLCGITLDASHIDLLKHQANTDLLIS